MNIHLASSLVENDMATMGIACIDEEIKRENHKHNSALIKLFNRRNTLSPTVRLPLEILEAIFIQCVCDHHAKDCCPCIQRVPSWVNISYVCRHWHNVALNCPWIWTHLFVVSPRWMEEQLARSKRAPLKPCMWLGSAPWARGLVKQVMNHVDRIQELHLGGLLSSTAHAVFSELSSPAPRLQNLKISTRTDSSYWSSVPFDGDTPSLRTLDLLYCPIPWNLFKLHNLTTLSLKHVPVQFRQNSADFLASLICMRDLTHLHLENALASATDFLSSVAFHTFQHFNLPRLAQFSIVAPPSTVIALLSCVNIPLATVINIQCHAERYHNPDHYAQFSSVVQQRFGELENQPLSCPRVRSLVVQCGGLDSKWTHVASLTASVSEPSSVEYQWINISFHIDNHTYVAEHREDHLVCDLCSSIQFPNVQRVDIIRPPPSLAFWKKMLEHLPNLRHLRLSQGRMPDLASVLFLTPHGHVENEDGCHDQGSHRVLVPALEKLELNQMLSAAPLQSDGLPALQPLYDALSSRKESRGQLTLTRCTIFKDDCFGTIFSMVGEWEGGHFHVLSESSHKPVYSDVDGLFDSE